MTHESLLGGLRAASLDTGGHLSAGEARRLACRAGIIPAVLDGGPRSSTSGGSAGSTPNPRGSPLPTATAAAPPLGCDAPPGLCHAHHDQPWSRGGPTDTTTGRLLCPRHHTLAHDPRYTTNPAAHGKLMFVRRT